jgi:hypothetical protein
VCGTTTPSADLPALTLFTYDTPPTFLITLNLRLRQRAPHRSIKRFRTYPFNVSVGAMYLMVFDAACPIAVPTICFTSLLSSIYSLRP